MKYSMSYATLIGMYHKQHGCYTFFHHKQTHGRPFSTIANLRCKMTRSAIFRMFSTFLSIFPFKQHNATWKNIINTKDCTPCFDIQSCGGITLLLDIIFFGKYLLLGSINNIRNVSMAVIDKFSVAIGMVGLKNLVPSYRHRAHTFGQSNQFF